MVIVLAVIVTIITIFAGTIGAGGVGSTIVWDSWYFSYIFNVMTYDYTTSRHLAQTFPVR